MITLSIKDKSARVNIKKLGVVLDSENPVKKISLDDYKRAEMQVESFVSLGLITASKDSLNPQKAAPKPSKVDLTPGVKTEAPAPQSDAPADAAPSAVNAETPAADVAAPAPESVPADAAPVSDSKPADAPAAAPAQPRGRRRTNA